MAKRRLECRRQVRYRAAIITPGPNLWFLTGTCVGVRGCLGSTANSGAMWFHVPFQASSRLAARMGSGPQRTDQGWMGLRALS